MDEKQHTAHTHAGCIFCTVIGPQMEAMMDHIWPENTREHFHNARVEVLKGMRGILDARIQHLSKKESKGHKVTVE